MSTLVVHACTATISLDYTSLEKAAIFLFTLFNSLTSRSMFYLILAVIATETINNTCLEVSTSFGFAWELTFPVKFHFNPFFFSHFLFLLKDKLFLLSPLTRSALFFNTIPILSIDIHFFGPELMVLVFLILEFL
jgi:hypothetical protein